jgi:predicted nucleotidyltransferase
MQMDRPFAAVTPTVDGDVLNVLARAEAEFTPPAVHRVIGRHSVDGVRRSLQRLASQGVVSVRPIGRALAYSLNRRHLAWPAIEHLSRLREELVGRITAAVGGWEIKPELVALFGSAAVGPMRTDSDVDVLAVRPDRVDDGDIVWRTQIGALESEVHSWTGNDCRVLEFALDEVKRTRKDERVLNDIARHGIAAFGDIGLLGPTRRRTA